MAAQNRSTGSLFKGGFEFIKWGILLHAIRFWGFGLGKDHLASGLVS